MARGAVQHPLSAFCVLEEAAVLRDVAPVVSRVAGRPAASLVLVHGAGSGPWIYREWLAEFPGLMVSAADLQLGLDVSRASHADYAENLISAAAGLPEPVAICGWSMGGLVVLQASQALRPHSVVLLEPSPPAEVQGSRPACGPGTGVFDPEAVYGRFPPGIRARPESSRARAERKCGISVPSLPCPSLVIYGHAFPGDRGRQVAACYGSHTLAFPDLDHWGLVRDRRVRAAIATWLGVTHHPAPDTRPPGPAGPDSQHRRSL